MKPTNYASQLRGHNKKYQQDTISILKTDFKLIVNKESNPIPSLYKLFFRSIALIHIELEEEAIEIKTDNDEQYNKYVYHLSSDDHQKNFNIVKLIKLQKMIHDFAVSYTEDLDQGDEKTRLKKPEFRSLKPIQILESFQPDTQIYINKGRAKSVRKLGLTSYTEMIKYSKDIEIQGKDRIHNCDTHFDKIQLISDFVKSHRNFIKTMHELNAIDPQNSLLKHFRIILESHSYRVRYIDSTNNESTSNICNGVILLDSPVTAIEPNKPARKRRNDTKVNLPVYLTKVFVSGTCSDENIHFCLSDVEDLSIRDKLENIIY
ncbi:hypothetical protein FGD67_03685 [Colwellia sp. M166]|uniref:hypothetical protein n=1 Tax=Colwellia sp. M166 TaxID=2583805 RepID=UPI00211E8F40|nr:hypothetical protein [Colwellia sp. M166]UUO22409.1 hypothetical protein FGD67_03685 [Colwellia sp. M166]|tara:strand:+ start:5968 stop:6924 length:957 start_codon:yes stop_codon:yes gene_type:complete